MENLGQRRDQWRGDCPVLYLEELRSMRPGGCTRAGGKMLLDYLQGRELI